jgi:hypothetical protein
MLVMTPSPIRRTRSLPRSAMYSAPSAPTARPVGRFSCALVGAPPSPALPALPVPATAVMVPSTICRTRWLPVSLT